MDSNFGNVGVEETEDAFEFDDIDIDELERTLNLDLLTKSTKKQYDVQLKKFSTFLNIPWNPNADVVKEAFTDERMASFLLDLAAKNDYKPHARKSAVAALGFMVKKHGFPSLMNNHLRWPLTEKAMQVNLCHYNHIL